MEIKRALRGLVQGSIRVAVLVEKSKRSRLGNKQIRKKIEREINMAPSGVIKTVKITKNINYAMEERIKKGEFDIIFKVNKFGHIIVHPNY